MAVRERGPDDIQKVVWGEVRCRWGAVVVAVVEGLVGDVEVSSVVIIGVKVVDGGLLTLTCLIDKVSCFFENWFSLSSEPWYC